MADVGQTRPTATSTADRSGFRRRLTRSRTAAEEEGETTVETGGTTDAEPEAAHASSRPRHNHNVTTSTSERESRPSAPTRSELTCAKQGARRAGKQSEGRAASHTGEGAAQPQRHNQDVALPTAEADKRMPADSPETERVGPSKPTEHGTADGRTRPAEKASQPARHNRRQQLTAVDSGQAWSLSTRG